MAFNFPKALDPELEQMFRHFYQSLPDKDRAGFAAVEAMKLGDGGIAYIATVLGCDPLTIEEGIRKLKQLPDDEVDTQDHGTRDGQRS